MFRNLKIQRPIVGIVIINGLFWFILIQFYSDSTSSTNQTRRDVIISPTDQDYLLPLIFIGGFIRSGTTLIRAMLDAHEDIRCGPETFIIPDILDTIKKYETQKIYLENGLQKTITLNDSSNTTFLNDLVRRFILRIVMHIDERPTTYYCNKEPLNIYYLKYLEKLFPNSRFIYMVRDPRAVVLSKIHHKHNSSIVTPTLYRQSLELWNNVNIDMHLQCTSTNRCLLQHYEQLVLQPIRETKKIFKFLNIPWSVEVLHHEKHMNETRINPLELSSDQVQKPIYLDALTEWFGTVPISARELDTIAPMAKLLGYDPYNERPYYEDPDDFVMKKGIWKDNDNEKT